MLRKLWAGEGERLSMKKSLYSHMQLGVEAMILSILQSQKILYTTCSTNRKHFPQYAPQPELHSEAVEYILHDRNAVQLTSPLSGDTLPRISATVVLCVANITSACGHMRDRNLVWQRGCDKVDNPHQGIDWTHCCMKGSKETGTHFHLSRSVARSGCSGGISFPFLA